MYIYFNVASCMIGRTKRAYGSSHLNYHSLMDDTGSVSMNCQCARSSEQAGVGSGCVLCLELNLPSWYVSSDEDYLPWSHHDLE